MSRESLFVDADIADAKIGCLHPSDISHIICFYALDGTEMLKLDLKTKDIFVKGELVENNQQVVDGLKEFLSCYF